MLAAIGPMGFCLLLIAFMPNLWTTTLIVLAFFFAYYVYEPPYRGLYPDLLPPSTYGRAQGIQHVMRGIALGAALVGGGFLLKVWHAAPFVLAAFVTTAACAIPIVFVREDGGHGRVFEGVRAYFKRSWRIFREEAEVRRFLLANAAWEGTFAAARTFVVLTCSTACTRRRRSRRRYSAQWRPVMSSPRYSRVGWVIASALPA